MVITINILENDGNGLDAFKLLYDRFHFTNLYSESTKLNLIIHSSEYIVFPIFCDLCKVSRPIEPDSIFFHKSFGILVWTIIVSPTNAFTCNIQFPNHVWRQRIGILIHNLFINIKHRFSDGDFIAFKQTGIAIDGGLSRAIEIIYFPIGIFGKQVIQSWRKCLTANQICLETIHCLPHSLDFQVLKQT